MPLVLLLCLIQSWRPLGGGFDFWAHASVGRWISDHGLIPTQSLYLWSSPGFPWVYHSWLSQFGFYQLVHYTGPIGVMIFNSLMVCAVFTLLWKLWQRRAGVMPFFAPAVFYVAIFVSSPRFQPRQELFTALLLVIFLAWMLVLHEERAWDERDARPVAVWENKSFILVAIFALWINLHALVLFPLVLLWAAAVADAIQYKWDQRAKSVALLAVACSFATLCNPWGIGYWAAAGVLKSGSQADKVQEWWSVWVQWPDMAIFVYCNAFLMLMALWGWAANPKRRWAELLWLLGTAVLFQRSRRLMWMMAIVCLVVIASNAASYGTGVLWRRWRASTRQPPAAPESGLRLIAHAGIWTVVALGIGLLGRVFIKEKSEFSPLTGVSRLAPRGAADWILRQHAPHRTFTDYELSSYFHWRFNGADNSVPKVSLIGRRPLYVDLLNAYPDNTLDNYFEILEATKTGRSLIDRYGINTIVLGKAHIELKKEGGKITHRPDKLVAYLENNPAWRRGFKDYAATVWVRRKPLAPAGYRPATANRRAPARRKPRAARRRTG